MASWLLCQDRCCAHPQVLARAFSRTALERYVPRLQGALRREVRSWCAAPGPVSVYEAAKALTFRMAALILLGLRLEEAQCAELTRTFEQLVENLFSLPLDVPFSGLRKVTPAQHLCLWAPWCWRASGMETDNHLVHPISAEEPRDGRAWSVAVINRAG